MLCWTKWGHGATIRKARSEHMGAKVWSSHRRLVGTCEILSKRSVFGDAGPYGENSLQSDQTATNSSRRQNAILVTFFEDASTW